MVSELSDKMKKAVFEIRYATEAALDFMSMFADVAKEAAIDQAEMFKAEAAAKKAEAEKKRAEFEAEYVAWRAAKKATD